MVGFKLAWPVLHPVIIQHFGQNLTGIPDFYKQYGLPGHEGMDFEAAKGDKVLVAADGIIDTIRVEVPKDPLHHPYGNQVTIKHDDGFVTEYCHLSAFGLIRKDYVVKAGDVIGYAGNTGHIVHGPNSDGTHLHFMLRLGTETRNGYPNGVINPEPYLKET